MSRETNNKDAQIKRDLGLVDDALLNDGIRMLMKQANHPDIKNILNAMGGRDERFIEYSKLFAQGMQWVHERFPHTRGVKEVIFAHPNMKIIRYDHDSTPLHITTRAKLIHHRFLHDPELSYITIPWSDIIQFQTWMDEDKSRGQQATRNFTVKSRQRLGSYNIRESVFIGAIEEAYHAVQNQNKPLRERLEKEEQELIDQVGNIETYCANNHLDPHDVKPRELDVVPMLEHGLAEFRAKQNSFILAPQSTIDPEKLRRSTTDTVFGDSNNVWDR